MSKVDPRLAMLLRLPPSSLQAAHAEWQAGLHTGLPPVFSDPLYAHLRFGAATGLAHGAAVSPRVSVLVKFAGSEALVRQRLTQRGFVVRSVAGSILTALAPLSAVENVVSHDLAVRFVELGRFARPHMDRTVPEIGAAARRLGTPSFTGEGIVIGLIDTDGLDFYHADLRHDDGTTRLVHLWDQRVDDGTGHRTPATWGYGSEFHAADLDQDLAGPAPYAVVRHRPVVPPHSANHATHTMGIAAGNGRASKAQPADLWGKYTGVAPRASLIYVNTFASGTKGLADLAEVCDAVDYIFARAGDAPCVVNISLGDDLGPHDGTSLVEQFIDAKLEGKAGRAVVIAAGNSGLTDQHTEVVIPAGGAATLELRVDAPVSTAEAWQLWYRGDDSLDVFVTAPSGVSSQPIKPNHAPVPVTVDSAQVTVASMTHDARNQDNVIEMLMRPSGAGPIAVGVWTITLSRTPGHGVPAGETRVHGWIDGNTGRVQGLGDTATIRWSAGVRRCSLTTPATAEQAITVGNYLLGVAEPYNLAPTSSVGPTRGAHQKPELAAPGGLGVRAPAARLRTPGAPATADPTVDYRMAIGTSQSAAHVSGLVALLFEQNEKSGGHPLSASETKAKLEAGADAASLMAVPDPLQGFGWGRVRAAN